MEGFTPEQLLAIREYFCEPDCNQPHGEVVATQLLAAMLASGKYELEDYPRLAEFHNELKRGEVEEPTSPKSPESEKDSTNFNSEADYDPIPF